MGDIGPRVGDIPPRLGQDTLMVIAVEQGILCVLSTLAIPTSTSGADSVDFEASGFEDDDEASSVLLLEGRLGDARGRRDKRRVLTRKRKRLRRSVQGGRR